MQNRMSAVADLGDVRIYDVPKMIKRLLILVALTGCGGGEDEFVDCTQGSGRCEPECSPFPAFDPNAPSCIGHNEAAENGVTEIDCAGGVAEVDGRIGCCVPTVEGEDPNDDVVRWFECEGQ